MLMDGLKNMKRRWLLSEILFLNIKKDNSLTLVFSLLNLIKSIKLKTWNIFQLYVNKAQTVQTHARMSPLSSMAAMSGSGCAFLPLKSVYLDYVLKKAPILSLLMTSSNNSPKYFFILEK
jgi:hypothetical protein